MALQILKDAPVVILVLDLEGRIQHVNSFFERLTGYRLDDVRGGDWFDTFLPEGDRERIRALFGRSREGAHVSGYVNPIVTRSGEERQIEWTDDFLRDDEGRVTGILAIGQDVTERVATRDALRASEQRLAMVLANVTDGFFTLDREWRYADINPAGARMVGHTPEELVGRVYTEAFPEAVGTIWERTYRHVMNTGEAATVEEYYEPLDQWFEANVFPFADGISVFFRDISIRKRAERALQDERERLREAHRIAKLGSWELDLVTNSLIWSDEIFRIFEIDTARFGASYEAFLAAIHPDDRAAVDAAYQASVANRASYEIVHRLLMPDGRIKWVRERGQTHYDDGGRPLRSIGTVQDVSEQVQAELRLRNILDGIFAFVGLYDLEGTLVEVNRAPLEIAGLRREDVIGKPFWEAYWWSHARDTQDQVRSALVRAARGEVVRDDFVVRIGDGRFITVDTVFGPLRDVSGRIDGVVGSGVDITDRKNADDAARRHLELLREREARLALVFNHTSDTMLLLSVDADGTLRVAAANRSFVDRISMITKVDEADLIGLTLEALTLEIYRRPQATLAQYQESLRRVIDTRTPLIFEHSTIFPTGLIFAEVALVPVLDGAGACIQVLWSSRDVTARKQADAQVRASLREKETLLREIHHRVKNNLQVIAGLLHFQAKSVSAPEDVAAFSELRQRIFAMTLLHERIYQSPDVARVIFCDYVRALVEELGRSFAPHARIRIDITTTDDVRLPIELAMPGGMIVSELVTNALKYAFPGTREGTVTVSVQVVGDRVVLGVDDDGVGFPDGFEPGAGRGFGWELVRTLVMQIDGAVETTTDRGAHVRVSFAAPSSAEGQHA
jgi:PAS domain S-box-containing protein